jgi:hypothetical protein
MRCKAVHYLADTLLFPENSTRLVAADSDTMVTGISDSKGWNKSFTLQVEFCVILRQTHYQEYDDRFYLNLIASVVGTNDQD